MINRRIRSLGICLAPVIILYALFSRLSCARLIPEINSSIAVIEVKGDEASYTGNDRIVQESEWGQWGNSSIPYHNLYYPRFGDVDNDGIIDVIIGYDGDPSTFVFENNEELQEEVKSFRSYKATTIALQYYEAYRKCLMMIRQGKL